MWSNFQQKEEDLLVFRMHLNKPATQTQTYNQANEQQTVAEKEFFGIEQTEELLKRSKWILLLKKV